MYLLSSDRELNALASLDLGLDEGADSVDREEHHDSKDETEEEVEGGVSHLSTNGPDGRLGLFSEGSDLPVLVVTAELAPLVRRVDDRVLKANVQSI